MTTEQVTIPITAEETQAAAAFQKLGESILKTDAASSKANGQMQALGEVILEAGRNAAQNKGYDELKRRIENANDTTQEYGATLDDQRANLDDLRTATDRYGITLAQGAKVLEKVSDEAEQGRVGLDAYARTQQVATLTGERFEDSAKLVGLALGGNVEVLKKLDGPAQKAAARIETIADKQTRARLIQLELNRAQARANSVTAKLGDRYQELAVRLGPLGPAFKLVGAGILALGGIIAGFVGGAVKHYLSSSAKMKRSTDRFNKALDELKFQFGGAIVAGSETGSMMDDLTGAVKDATKWVKENRAQIAEWARMALAGGAKVVKGGAHLILGLAMIATGVVEGIEGLVQKGIAPFMQLIADGAYILAEMKMISRETANEMATMAQGLQKFSAQNVSFKNTEKLIKLLDTISDGADNFSKKMMDAKAASKAAGKIGGKVKKGGGGGGPVQYDDWAIESAANTLKTAGPVNNLRIGVDELTPAFNKAAASGQGFDAVISGVLVRAKALGKANTIHKFAKDTRTTLLSAVDPIIKMEDDIDRAIEKARSYASQWETVGSQIKRTGELVNSTAADMATSVGQSLGSGLVTGEVENLGDVMRSSLATGVQSMIPILNTTAAALLGLQTMNPLATLAATALLGTLVGAVSTMLAPTSSSGTRASSSDAAAAVRAEARALREQAGQSQMQNITVVAQFGTDSIDARSTRIQRTNSRNRRSAPQEVRPQS